MNNGLEFFTILYPPDLPVTGQAALPTTWAGGCLAILQLFTGTLHRIVVNIEKIFGIFFSKINQLPPPPWLINITLGNDIFHLY